jgi:hypothetical protein
MFGLEAFEADALFCRGLLVEELEHPLDVVHMAPCLLQVPLESVTEFGILDLRDQLRQRFVGELLLNVENVPKLMQK